MLADLHIVMLPVSTRLGRNVSSCIGIQGTDELMVDFQAANMHVDDIGRLKEIKLPRAVSAADEISDFAFLINDE